MVSKRVWTQRGYSLQTISRLRIPTEITITEMTKSLLKFRRKKGRSTLNPWTTTSETHCSWQNRSKGKPISATNWAS